MSGLDNIVRDPLTALQRNTIAFIHDRLPMLKACEAHEGRFTPDDLNAIRTKAPAVHIGFPAVRNAHAVGYGQVRLEVKTVGALLAKDTVYQGTETIPKRKLDKIEAAAILVTSLLAALPNAELGKGVMPPTDIKADNLTTYKVAQGGIAMWGLHWTNTLTLQDPQEDGVSLAHLFYSWAPEIGTDHEPDYQDILGGAS